MASQRIEQEQARWQEAIHAECCKLAPGANIDGAGCDSGDPLDLSLAEIAQTANHYANILDDAGQHLKNYREGGTPQDVIDACEELKLADEFMNSTPGLDELVEGQELLVDCIALLWQRLQEAEAAALSPMGRQIAGRRRKREQGEGRADQ